MESAEMADTHPKCLQLNPMILSNPFKMKVFNLLTFSIKKDKLNLEDRILCYWSRESMTCQRPRMQIKKKKQGVGT